MEDDNSFSLPKKRNIFSSHFQYSERTKATTETNNNSKESSETQHFEKGRTRAWQYQEGATPTCRRKHFLLICYMGAEQIQYLQLF